MNVSHLLHSNVANETGITNGITIGYQWIENGTVAASGGVAELPFDNDKGINCTK